MIGSLMLEVCQAKRSAANDRLVLITRIGSESPELTGWFHLRLRFVPSDQDLRLREQSEGHQNVQRRFGRQSSVGQDLLNQ